MAAAFELTEPRLRDKYDVTVYQPGWRLGGKCASGRRGPENRIEEHGLHVWFGFYANSFSLIQRCYEERAPPPGSPLKTWEDAFKKCNDIVLLEQWRGQWTPWHLTVPPDDLVPGTRHDVTIWEFLARLLDWLVGQWDAVRDRHGDAIPPPAAQSGRRLHLPLIDHLAAEISHPVESLGREGASHLLELACKVAGAHASSGDRGSHSHIGGIAALLGAFKRWMFGAVLQPLIDNPDVRRFAIFLDFWTTTINGMLADRVFESGFGAINDKDLRVWLEDKRHPDLAAGKALQAMIRIVVEYKGAVLWKLQAGMGDTVFTPLYDVLLARGVRFRFFHQVTNLRVGDDGRSVKSIEVQPQARLEHGDYDPIVDAAGLRCWPSEPSWNQLTDGEELKRRGINFEYELNPLGLDPIVLNAGEDFDQIVCGIPVGALGVICEELAAANPRFRSMLENSSIVMTEGIQLWLARTATELGWPFETSIATSYVARADTYSNMSQLLTRETWGGADRPADVVYLCGVLKHVGVETQADADRRVRDNALQFLNEDAGPLWPGALQPHSDGFDWAELVDASGHTGMRRLDAQFFRANFQPTERYVMTRAGSVASRLGADESGFENLKLAGDWTRNGIDGGSVEAAMNLGHASLASDLRNS